MKFIGEHPALDLVNTVGGWSADRFREDKLENIGDLIRWAELAKLIDAREAAALIRRTRSHPAEARGVLARARTLRGVLHRLFDCTLKRREARPADVAFLGNALRAARRHYTLTARDHEFVWRWDQRPSLDSILWRVTQSAADLLTSPDLGRLRRCAGADCGWMFLDTTRNHSRHWCDMKDCGNLAKVRRFRARRAE